MDRRDFLKKSLQAGSLAMAAPLIPAFAEQASAKKVAVAFVKTSDRTQGVNKAIDLLQVTSLKGRDLFIKPNFNSSDPPPGSTHLDTLGALLRKLSKMEAKRLSVGDRSGMGETRKVMESREVLRLCRELNCETVIFDELTEKQWEHVPNSSAAHWSKGFFFPAPVIQAEGIVQTCNLKTHRFGGHFTMSLKNSVGLAAKFVPGDSYNYMKELHTSADQRKMIAEINAAYQPLLVVMDGVEAFVNGGPEAGKRVNSGVVLASTDRVAIDAVGVALLRHFGTTPEVTQGKIFEQEQIARAVQLNLGVTAPGQIELVTDDPDSAKFAETIQQLLIS